MVCVIRRVCKALLRTRLITRYLAVSGVNQHYICVPLHWQKGFCLQAWMEIQDSSQQRQWDKDLQIMLIVRLGHLQSCHQLWRVQRLYLFGKPIIINVIGDNCNQS
jgi:hypothetical protein